MNIGLVLGKRENFIQELNKWTIKIMAENEQSSLLRQILKD